MATAAAGARREADSSRRTPPPRGEERERERGGRAIRGSARGRGGVLYVGEEEAKRSEAKGEEKDGVSRTR